MTQQFLKEIIESYCFDNNINKSNIEKLYNEVRSILEEVRLLNFDLYNYVNEENNLQQQKIIYSLCDYALEPIDETVTAGAVVATSTLSGPILMALAGIGAISGFLIHVFRGTWLTSKVSKMLTSMDNMATSAFKYFKSMRTLKEARVYDAIITNRLESCAKKCGVRNLKDIGKFAGSAMFGGAGASKITKENVDCLIECYLYFHVNTIAMLVGQYRQCIVSTGGQPGKMDNIAQLLHYPLDSECAIYYDLIKKYLGTFEDAISALYEKEPSERDRWIRIMNDKLGVISNKPKQFVNSMKRDNVKTNVKRFPPRR